MMQLQFVHTNFLVSTPFSGVCSPFRQSSRSRGEGYGELSASWVLHWKMLLRISSTLLQDLPGAIFICFLARTARCSFFIGPQFHFISKYTIYSMF